MSAEGITVMQKLQRLSNELGQLADRLDTAEDAFAPVEDQYVEFIENFEVGLYDKVEQGELGKLPSAEMRLKLARQRMPVELLGQYQGLLRAREQLTTRMRAVKAQVEAQRSILSALKEGMI